MDDNQFGQFTPYTKKTQSPKVRAFVYVIIFAIIIAGAMIIGNVFLSQRSGEDDAEPTPTVAVSPTPTPEEESSPTPEEEVTPARSTTPTPTGKVTVTPTTTAKKGITVRVLNGSGTQGAAGDAASVLLDAGYTVTGTGNADTFDYEQTVIQIKKSKQTEAATIRKALSSEYTVSSTIETLAETAQVDAIVIVGAK